MCLSDVIFNVFEENNGMNYRGVVLSSIFYEGYFMHETDIFVIILTVI